MNIDPRFCEAVRNDRKEKRMNRRRILRPDVLEKQRQEIAAAEEAVRKEAEAIAADKLVVLTQEAFKLLPEYSMSIPTGTWPGKQWKCKCKGKDNWWMLEYYEKPGDKEFMYIKAKKITIREDGLRVDQVVDPNNWSTLRKAFREKEASCPH